MSGEPQSRSGMVGNTCIPSPPLSYFVNSFHLYEESGTLSSYTKERVLPTGTTELVINLRGDALRVFDRRTYVLEQSIAGSMICGAHSEFFVIDASQKSAVLTVNFKPGRAFPFLGLPADELHNTCVSLEALWGTAAREMREQILAAETPAMKFRVLEKYLAARLSQSMTRHPAVGFALNMFLTCPQNSSITGVAEQVGFSSRHFGHIFRQEVGMTPKLFGRVQRFQQVIHYLQDAQSIDWMDIALACGYYDQAHFIHDFRAFSDLNPTTYRILQGPQLNHLPLSS